MRHQLPAYSPVSTGAAFLATKQFFHIGHDPRPGLCALLGREYDASSVVLCGSGTQALTIAIQEARRRVEPETPVALPAFSCFDVASAAVGANARASLYDLDPDTLAPDLESLERVLRAGAGVVVVAPLYGVPVDWQALTALAQRYDATLVEDAAQGNGASWKGKRLGALGEIATLSFGRGKGWTGAAGGAVLMHDAASPAREDFPEPEFSRGAAVTIGIIALCAFARPALFGIPTSIPALRLGQTVYLPPRPVSKLARGAAATLLATHEAARSEAKVRRVKANELHIGIAENPKARSIRVERGGTAGYLRLPVRLYKGIVAFKSPQRALRLGIASSYPMSLAELPQLRGRLAGPERVWEGAQTLVRELVTVPTHSRLSARELGEIIGIFREL